MQYTQEISRLHSLSRSIRLLSLALGFLLLAGRVVAQDASIGVRVGSLGLGIEGTMRIVNPVGVRLGLNAFSFRTEDEADDVNYNFDVDLRSESLLADLYLSKTGFRLTAGMLRNGNEARLESDFVGEVEIGDST